MSTPWELDLGTLDQDEPFEIDDVNGPHLAKHMPFTADDILDAFFDRPVVVDAPHEPALWIMIAEVPGDMVTVPLMPPSSGSNRQVRPIGIYRASDNYRRIHRNAWE